MGYKRFTITFDNILPLSDQGTEILNKELIAYLESMACMNHVVCAQNEHASISQSGPKHLEERAGRRLKRPWQGVLASISISLRLLRCARHAMRP